MMLLTLLPTNSHKQHSRLKLRLRLSTTAIFICLCLALASQSKLFADEQLPPDDEFKASLKQAIEQADSFVDKFDAEVWLKDMNQRLKGRARHIPKQERLALLSLVHKYASLNKLNPQLVLSLIQVESNFDRFAVSKAGAKGLMQVMPFWVKEIGRPDDNLFDIETNIKYGCAILSIYMRREQQNVIKALARYHGSYPKDYYSMRVVRAWQSRWQYY
jgi:soluble lytic murein transglycosylase-like protein